MAAARTSKGLTLQRAVAAPAALGTIAVSLIAGVTIAVIYLNQATARLEGDMRHALASVRQAAASAAWTVDRPAAELIVQGLLTDPRITRAGFEADAFDWIERGPPVERARRFEEPLVYDVQGSPKQIGRIYVETNPRMVERPLANATIGIGLTMAGIAAAGSLWIIWLLQVRVGRPVQILARHAQDLATKPLKEVVPLDLDSVGRVDEIRALGKILDELRSGNLTTLSELADRRRSELEAQTSKLDALARMSGGVAHEFNNLLQPIATLSDMGRDNIACSDADAAARYRQYFETISSSARLAAAIAADFLTFCGSTQRPSRIGDVSAAIREAAAKLRPLLANGRELRLDLEPDSFCRFDDLGLVQILNNLLKNANEAFPSVDAGAQYVAIRVAKTDGGDTIELSVADNGPGMSEAVRARVFEPFFTTKGACGGSGLGLSVVYGIVTAWGGSVDLETRPGAGSKFVIRLPRGSRFEMKETRATTGRPSPRGS